MTKMPSCKRHLTAHLNRKEFLRQLSLLRKNIQSRLETGCPEFPMEPDAGELRREQALQDFAFFRRIYFPHYINKKAGDSALHTALDSALPVLADTPQGQRLAVAAPRGEAKSTFVSLFFVLWCILTGRKRFLLLIADAKEQAASLLEAIKSELEANPRLIADFPEHTGQGRFWNTDFIITRSNAKILAMGAGTKMRGLRHGAYRPDLVVLDDLENDEQVTSPEQRQKLHDWLHKTVLNLGPPDGSMDTIYIGTVLHYDSVLARTLANPAWDKLVFKAIQTMPDNMHLWDTWENIYISQGQEAASAFYNTRQKAMDQGASVSWPQMRPLYTLMRMRAENRAAFDAEQQNDPLAKSVAPFSQSISYWEKEEEDWLYFGAIDPSLGKRGAGRDPSAILVGGINRKNMTLCIVAAEIKERHPDDIIADALRLQEQYQCLLWAVEAVQFQEFFVHVLGQKAAENGIPFPVRAVKPHTDKRLRIESLQPHLANRRILLHKSQHTLIHQLMHFPKANHDDGPDALHMLWEAATKGFDTLRQEHFTPVPRQQLWR